MDQAGADVVVDLRDRPVIAVTDPAAAAPASGFAFRLGEFEGPLDLLLSLISKRRLEVTELALHEVIDEFIAYIRHQGADWDLDEATSFLVVAATLLDLKAARLLPSGEVDSEDDLALLEARDLLFARLLQYRAFKDVSGWFAQRLDDERGRFARTAGLEPQFAKLLPEVLLGVGPRRFAELAARALTPRDPEEVRTDHIHMAAVNVADETYAVAGRLQRAGTASFRSLVADASSTAVVVARFLGLLELHRQRVVAFEQAAALGELRIRWTGPTAGFALADTDNYDGTIPAADRDEPPARREEQT